ncbi:MAG TPA: ABC transporter ATP-binding protein [Patescibacteria group bacterium]|jgi:putative ABC transport system ATP-binding protein|nr:ABC transporter ATP-binding protein [Patescibacteria group bacterium]
MTTLVQLEGAARRFGSGHTEVTALHPTSLSVEAGELLAVMGPSGSGKTTLLSLVGGLDRPTEGHVVVAGQDVGSLKSKDLAILRRRTVGYVFQDLNLLAGLTARENVAIPLELDGKPIGEARAAAEAALESVGLASLADRFPDDLSGGEQQRVAIARALVGGRQILLADEPTGALDSITGESVMRLLRAHCDRGGTAILVTHDAAHAAWADRVVFLRDGRLVDEARPASNPDVAGEGGTRLAMSVA